MRRPNHRRGVATVSVIAAAALTSLSSLTACGSPTGTAGHGAASASGGPGSASKITGTVTVFAASSLKEAFTTLGHRFEQAHPGTRVVLNLGASSGLATQITQGAPADVFASASAKNMDQVVAAGTAPAPRTFARNAMEVAVPPSNPARVASVRDLGRPGVKVALCQPQVPCGVTAATVFARAGVQVHAVSQELDVKSVLAKVTLGEVDAGVVYVTDVKAAGARVRGIPISGAVNASTSYPIATLSTAPNKQAAQAFTDFVLSGQAAPVLADAGFGKP
jgi:molybdate transport system substrate-binding protein